MKILVVEDSKTFLTYLAGVFEMLNLDAEIQYAESLQEAKDKIDGSDLVLLDLMLSDSRNPIKTIKEINKADGEIPIIVITGDNNPELMYKSVRFGVKDYLLKETVTPKKIGDSIKRVSEKNSLMKLFKEKSEALLDCCNQMVERAMAL